MFQDIIELLLQKKADLREIIEREFAERSAKIDELLALAGYVEPVPEIKEEVENAEETEVPEMGSNSEDCEKPY